MEYEKQETTILRRQYRRLMALTLLNTILLAGFIVGPSVGPMAKTQWKSFQEKRAQRQAVEARKTQYAAALQLPPLPADRVMYEENPDEAAKLLAIEHSPYRVIGDASLVYLPPHPWTQPVYRTDTPVPSLFGVNATILFLHARTDLKGRESLVRVQLRGNQSFNGAFSPSPGSEHDYDVNTNRTLTASVISEQAVAQGTRRLVLQGGRAESHVTWIIGPGGNDDWTHGKVTLEPRGLFRFYPGQVDPSDASHFTIDYELDGQRGTIDGWLRENSVVELLPRQGATVDRDPNGFTVTWDTTIKPATTPPTSLPAFQR